MLSGRLPALQYYCLRHDLTETVFPAWRLAAVEWFASLDGSDTRRAYQGGLQDFCEFVGLVAVQAFGTRHVQQRGVPAQGTKRPKAHGQGGKLRYRALNLMRLSRNCSSAAAPDLMVGPHGLEPWTKGL